MNYRDIIVTLVVLGSLPFAFRRPFVGLIVFSWLAYMRVQDLCWAFARTMRFSYYIAIAMFAGFIIFEKKKIFTPDFRLALFLVLTGIVSLSVVTTRYEVTATTIQYYMEFLKIMAVSIFTVAIVDNSEKLRILLWTIALSLGFFGIKSGLWGILTGGGRQILRGPGGMLQDNNDFSLALTMNLPFLFYLGLSESNKWVKRGLIGAMGLTCFTILLTHSRGGFLSMCVTLGIMTWRSRNRLAGFGLAALAAVVFVLFAPSGVKERLSTIQKFEEDSSAQARFHTWGIALKMITRNPLIGVGFRNFQSAYPEYDPDPLRQKGTEVFFVAHNSYLQLSAESGLLALGTYLFIFVSCLWLLRRIRIQAMQRYDTGWIINYVRLFEAAVFGFLTGATFLNRGHFDFAYHILSIIIAFGIVATKEMEEELKYPLREGSGVARFRERMGFGGLHISEPQSLGAAAHARGGFDLPAAGGGFEQKTPAAKPGFGSRFLPAAFPTGFKKPRL
ncbi:MAG: putative O-glycosylation ligase, exosortase A system-associated [Planctomycetes bacterium]|nr:putative O-glycosylation ligase, exosortase A system-associated [Planctomycetota bacterium]